MTGRRDGERGGTLSQQMRRFNQLKREKDREQAATRNDANHRDMGRSI